MALESRCLKCGSDDVEYYWQQRTRTRQMTRLCSCGHDKAVEVVIELPRQNPWATVRCARCGTVLRHGEYFYIDDWD